MVRKCWPQDNNSYQCDTHGPLLYIKHWLGPARKVHQNDITQRMSPGHRGYTLSGVGQV